MHKKVVVNDKYQTNYVYILSEPTGQNFDEGFEPELTPQEMLAMGVFEGKYMTDGEAEFPQAWFEAAKLSSLESDPQLNYFKVAASQPLSYWQKKGWIHPQDPRGWFQWYCRYYFGRRSTDDERQIQRWRAMRRHIAQIKKNCLPRHLSCRPRQRQALLHWAYDARKI